MASRYAVQALALGLRCGEVACSEGRAPASSRWKGLRSVITSGSVITSLAGFEVAFAFPFVEGFSGLVLGLQLGSAIPTIAGLSAPKSVITLLAGFAARHPQPPGGRTAIPAAFGYWLAVSRRMRVAFWICRIRRQQPRPARLGRLSDLGKRRLRLLLRAVAARQRNPE
jgi:hypothetical protein